MPDDSRELAEASPVPRRPDLRRRSPRRPLLCLVLLAALLAPVARADIPAEAAIRAALEEWRVDFNAGRADRVCDLFDRDLRYDFRGFPERGYDAVCNLLRHSLADRARRFSYALEIREVLVSGDLAVVRLTWTLTARKRGTPDRHVSQEPGLDVFQRQADGKWRIIRYIAYEAP